MGLRPSVKHEKEGINNGNPRPRMTDIVEETPDGNENESKAKIESSETNRSDQKATDLQQYKKQKRPPLQPPKQEAWTARGKLLLNFHDAIARAINSPEMIQKCSQIASEMSTSADDEDLPSLTLGNGATSKSCMRCQKQSSLNSEYEAEASQIVDSKSKRDAEVRNKSLAVGLFSFLTLRLSRNGLPWLRNYFFGRINSGYQFDKLSNDGSVQNKIFQSVQTQAISSKPSTSSPRNVFNLAMDFFIASCLTFLSGTYVFMPRPSAYIEDMAELPMVEGKSLYAEMVCPPLMKEYKKVLDQYGGRWPVQTPVNQMIQKQQQIQKPTQEDISLNVIRQFVENCSKRSKYERALLEERNAFKSLDRGDGEKDSFHSKLIKRVTSRMWPKESQKLGTVSVPSPGVPDEVVVNVDHDVYFLGIGLDENDANK